MKHLLHPPVVAPAANRRTSPPATAAATSALPAGASPHHDHAEFYPYHDFHDLHAMELPPPDRTRHPVWSTPRTLVTLLLVVHYPDGSSRIAADNDPLPTEDFDLSKAAAHLAFRAAEKIRK